MGGKHGKSTCRNIRNFRGSQGLLHEKLHALKGWKPNLQFHWQLEKKQELSMPLAPRAVAVGRVVASSLAHSLAHLPDSFISMDCFALRHLHIAFISIDCFALAHLPASFHKHGLFCLYSDINISCLQHLYNFPGL